jgi:hypothetical protein
MNIVNCVVQNFGFIGMFCFAGTDSIVKWNTVIGNTGDTLNYGTVVEGGATATITENRYHNFASHQYTRTEISAAIVSFPGAVSSTVSFNEFISCKMAVQHSGGIMTVTGNTFDTCEVGLINYLDPVVDATNNYWGVPSLNEADAQGVLAVEPKALSHKIDI